MNTNKNTTKIFEHILNLDYPRKSGSEGEKKAAQYIFSVFSEHDYKPTYEKFGYFPTSSYRLIYSVIFFTIYLIVSFINLAYLKNIIISIFAIIIPIIIIISLVRIDLLFKKMIKNNFKRIRNYEKIISTNKSLKKAPTECLNIIAEYNHPNPEKELYIVCHYDSISLRLSMKGLLIIGIIGIFSYFVYMLLYLLEFVLNFFKLEIFTSYWYIYFSFFLITIIFLNAIIIIRGFRTNSSHGSLDDGTGIAIILELSRIVKKLKPRLKITFITFSSEEIGFYGSSYYFYRNQNGFNKEAQVISIDMIGEVPPLCYVRNLNPIKKIKTDQRFNLELDKIAKENDIILKGINFFYPGSDFAVWLLNGYKANWIYTKSKWIHSRNDIPSKVNKKLISECLILLENYIKKYI